MAVMLTGSANATGRAKPGQPHPIDGSRGNSAVSSTGFDGAHESH